MKLSQVREEFQLMAILLKVTCQKTNRKPEQVDRIQDISRKTNLGTRRNAEDIDDFQDFS